MDNFNRFEQIANEHFDGHYTIMKFTTNYRVAFGTLHSNDYQSLRDDISRMPAGETLEEACGKCIEVMHDLWSD